MKSRRQFIMALATASVATATAQAQNSSDSISAPKTLDALKKNTLFVSKWTETEFKGRKFAFAVGDDLGDGESYIDLQGWVFNRHFEEWRRIFLVHTRSLYGVEFKHDTVKGVVSAYSTGNTPDLRGIEVFRFDLRATSDGSTYKK